MEMQMITLIQHVPEWCKDFTPTVWQIDSRQSLYDLPICKELTLSYGLIGYKEAALHFSKNELGIIFKKSAPIPHEAFVFLGKVNDPIEAQKILSA